VTKARVIRDMERKPMVGDAPTSSKSDSHAQTAASIIAADHPSKGYGFVEFKHHAHALAALRELNNNPNCSHVAKGVKLEKASHLFLIWRVTFGESLFLGDFFVSFLIDESRCLCQDVVLLLSVHRGVCVAANEQQRARLCAQS
jgi:RNA recognition motif-containing protein